MNIDFELVRKLQTFLKMLETEHGLKYPIVAGGCVRDMLLNKPIKDIDIFVEDPDFDVNNIKGLTIIKRYPPTGCSYMNTSSNLDEPDWTLLCQEAKYEGLEYPLQFIYTSDICKNIDCFACNISKVFLSSKDLCLSQEFLFDVELEMLTFNEDHLHNSSYEERIRAKYPEFS